MSETNQTIQDRIDDATFDFTMGDHAKAVEKLREVTAAHPDAAGAWHALAEVLLADKQVQTALEAAEKALSLNPEDVHINVSLSRIWVELGDKAKAEHFGAQARMMGWKVTLKEPKDPPA